MTDTETRPLHEIAREIRADWKKPNFGAVPHLEAMGTLSSMSDRYGAASARSVVLYFLANCNAWRGDTARRVKAELRAMTVQPKPKPRRHPRMVR